jgi:hypothetical protein
MNSFLANGKSGSIEKVRILAGCPNMMRTMIAGHAAGLLESTVGRHKSTGYRMKVTFCRTIAHNLGNRGV